ncbi:MAG: hypothetical protein ACON5D_16690 [Rubripirellula sp.]
MNQNKTEKNLNGNSSAKMPDLAKPGLAFLGEGKECQNAANIQ